MTDTLRNQVGRRRLRVVLVALGVLAVTLGLLARPVSGTAHAAVAKPRGGCSLRTLRGSFGGVQAGTTTATGPIAIQTLGTFYGNGHATARVTLMTKTRGPVNFTDTATYTLNRDCSGTLTARRSTGQTVHFRITVTQSGRSMYLLETDPGAVVTGTFQHV
jgi:hypothetical protein